MSKLFAVVPMERIVDHSSWTIHVCNLNTSASAKKKYPAFYDGVFLQAAKILNDGENKLLIIGMKDEVRSFQRERRGFCKEHQDRLSFANFRNMRGKNDWADYNNCLIIHTPNLPSNYYPLHFEYYSRPISLESNDLKMGIVGKGTKKHFGYSNSQSLDCLRESCLDNAVYQACKRISRRGTTEAHVYIITNNMRMINELGNNLKGATIKEFRLPNQSEIVQEKERCYTRSEPSVIKVRLQKLFSELVNGKHKAHECEDMNGYYKKKWITSMIGYEGKNLGRYLNEMEPEMIQMGIGKNQHKIIVMKDIKKDYS